MEEFVELVRRVYYKNAEELRNLEEYVDGIDHVVCGVGEGELVRKHKAVLRFYVK